MVLGGGLSACKYGVRDCVLHWAPWVIEHTLSDTGL